MVRQVTVNEEVTILASFRSGLSDVTVQILNDDGGDELAATTMTEQASTGIYKTTHTFDTVATYVARFTSNTQGKRYETEYDVVGYVLGGPTATNNYCSTDDVYSYTDLTTDDIDATTLGELIIWAQAQINHDIGVRIVEEDIEKIDEFRQNEVDGSNTVYYTKNSFIWFMGDLNNSGTLTIADAEVYAYDSSADTRTELTVSAIDEIGKITLSTAPESGINLTVTYVVVPISINDPHYLVRKGCIELSSALAYSKVEATDFQKVTLRDLTVQKTPQGYDHFMELYYKTIAQINSFAVIKKVIAPKKTPDMRLLQPSIRGTLRKTGDFVLYY